MIFITVGMRCRGALQVTAAPYSSVKLLCSIIPVQERDTAKATEVSPENNCSTCLIVQFEVVLFIRLNSVRDPA